MKGFLYSLNFSDQLRRSHENIISASVDLLMFLSSNFLPTPNRFYYKFTIRQLSLLVQSLLSIKPNGANSVEQLLRLWTFECQRVLEDKLTSSKEIDSFRSQLVLEIQNAFSLNWT